MSASLVDEAGRSVRLASRSRVGRDATDVVCASHPAVSHTHAEIAWTGERWTLRDLHSLHGTVLNGRRLKPGHPERLTVGDQLRFGGDAGPAWRVVNTTAPGAFASSLQTGAVIDAEGGFLVLPGPSEVVLYPDASGRWVAERDGVENPVREGQVFALAEAWRVHLDAPVATLGARTLTLAEITLVLRRSPDREIASARLRWPGGELDLGYRVHWLVVYALAEDLLEDTTALPDTRGWLDKQLLADTCALPLDHVDSYVSRVRANLVGAGVRDGRDIIDAGRQTQRRLRLNPEQIILEK